MYVTGKGQGCYCKLRMRLFQSAEAAVLSSVVRCLILTSKSFEGGQSSLSFRLLILTQSVCRERCLLHRLEPLFDFSAFIIKVIYFLFAGKDLIPFLTLFPHIAIHYHQVVGHIFLIDVVLGEDFGYWSKVFVLLAECHCSIINFLNSGALGLHF